MKGSEGEEFSYETCYNPKSILNFPVIVLIHCSQSNAKVYRYGRSKIVGIVNCNRVVCCYIYFITLCIYIYNESLP